MVAPINSAIADKLREMAHGLEQQQADFASPRIVLSPIRCNP
jgi:hypothetical protein